MGSVDSETTFEATSTVGMTSTVGHTSTFLPTAFSAPLTTTTASTTFAQTTTVIQSTTIEPTTIEPTTMEPTTLEQTTMEPTTMEPTTMEPATVKQTTSEPSTSATVSAILNIQVKTEPEAIFQKMVKLFKKLYLLQAMNSFTPRAIPQPTISVDTFSEEIEKDLMSIIRNENWYQQFGSVNLISFHAYN